MAHIWLKILAHPKQKGLLSEFRSKVLQQTLEDEWREHIHKVNLMPRKALKYVKIHLSVLQFSQTNVLNIVVHDAKIERNCNAQNLVKTRSFPLK